MLTKEQAQDTMINAMIDYSLENRVPQADEDYDPNRDIGAEEAIDALSKTWGTPLWDNLAKIAEEVKSFLSTETGQTPTYQGICNKLREAADELERLE